MTYESDLQLRAAGLEPMQNLPRKHRARYVVRLRDGRDVTIEMLKDCAVGWCYYAVDDSETAYEWGDFVGWRTA